MNEKKAFWFQFACLVWNVLMFVYSLPLGRYAVVLISLCGWAFALWAMWDISVTFHRRRRRSE